MKLNPRGDEHLAGLCKRRGLLVEVNTIVPVYINNISRIQLVTTDLSLHHT